MSNPQTTKHLTPTPPDELLPPDCMCCGAEPLSDHAENCNALAAMRAQAYPTNLGLNGREWYLNELDERSKRLAAKDAIIQSLIEALEKMISSCFIDVAAATIIHEALKLRDNGEGEKS